MSTELDTPVPELPSLADAPWLAWPATRAVLAALAAAGFEGRVVGGSVRNALMGLPVADVDIATPARPEAVVRACAAAGLHTVPTGLEHGTVTVVAHHTALEVTTLRRDVATDGRRAVVAFTEDWAEDAERRDFTMNALYCDGSGRLYDYVGGWPDLVARRIRFIGDADQRIAEDYLRILRFFRFYAAYAQGSPDAAAMAACVRGVAGMGRLSAERIRAELVKLLVAPRVVDAVIAMEDIGLLPVVLGAAPRPDVLASVVAAEAAFAEMPDAMLRLSALAIAAPDDIPRLADRLRLSNEERKALLVLDRAVVGTLGPIDGRRARQLVYARGVATSRRLAIGLMALEPARRDEATTFLATSKTWQPPELPVSGADLLALGIEPGPRVGATLKALEAWWVAEDFPDAARTRARLETMLAAGEAG
jgi:tRNA nucleotidyltransferase/poly(A) polymerase